MKLNAWMTMMTASRPDARVKIKGVRHTISSQTKSLVIVRAALAALTLARALLEFCARIDNRDRALQGVAELETTFFQIFLLG